MSFSRTSRRFASIVALTFVALPSRTNAQAAPGVSFTVNTTVVLPQSFSDMRGGTPAIHGKGVAAGGKVRVDLDRAEFTMDKLAPGDVLMTETGGPISVARTSDKSFAPLTADLQDQMLPTAKQYGLGDISAPRYQLIGADEPIEGRVTQHHRITGGYTMKGSDMSTSMVIEVWTVKLPANFSNPLLTFGVSAANGVTVAFENPLGEAFRKITDTPVKVVVSSSVSAHGMQFELSQTTTLTDIKDLHVDATRLTMPPAGFTRK